MRKVEAQRFYKEEDWDKVIALTEIPQQALAPEEDASQSMVSQPDDDFPEQEYVFNAHYPVAV